MVAGRKDRIVVSAVVGEDHKLIIDLPPDAPTGHVQVVVESDEPVTVEQPSIYINPERERLRAILLAAGKLGTAHVPPPGTVRPSDDEIRQAGMLPPDARPSEDIIRELREDD